MKNTRIALLAAFLGLSATASAATMINGVMVPDDLMNLARKAVAQNSPEEALKRPDNVFTKHPYYNQLMARFDFKKLNEEAAKLMVTTFTRHEIEALVRFQSSPEGQSISRKMQGYQQLVGAVVQNEMNAAIQGQVLTDGMSGQGAFQAPQTPKPVVPYTPPAAAPVTPAVPEGHGGSPIGK